MHKTHKAMLAAFCGNAIFGFSFLFSKMALAVTTPSVLLAARFLLALIIMRVVLWVCHKPLKFDRKTLGMLALMGIFQPVVYFYCENYGLMFSNATFSAVMIALVPIASLIYGALFMKERPTALQVICSVLSVAGVVWMALRQSTQGAITVWGVLLLIGAVICAVGFNVISRRSATTVGALERTYMMFLMGAVVFTVAAVVENIHTPMALLEPFADVQFVTSLLYLGVVSSVGAFCMINYANTHLPLSRATVFSNVITVVSVFAGVVILKETFDLFMLIAAVMIVVGIAGVQYFAKTRDEA